MKQKLLLFLVFPTFLLVSFGTSLPVVTPSIGVDNTVGYFSAQTLEFTHSARELRDVLQVLTKDNASLIEARKKLAACRLSFKRIEFFTEYFFPSETRMYNAAPVMEVEEPTLELVEPMGLQQIESLLYDGDPMANKPILLLQADALYSSVKDLKSLLYQFEVSDAQILESLRIELIRIMALSLSGYDAPSLKTGIIETREALATIQYILQPYLHKNVTHQKKIDALLSNAVKYLSTNPDFDSFDRMAFYTRFALPFQKELGLLIGSLGLELNTTTYLNYQAEHIFYPDALKIDNPADPAAQTARAQLGEKLFFDPALSASTTVSCATCHQPRNFFNDGLKRSPSLHPDSVLKRNTPTLLYSGRQHMQFWDGRSEKLEDQILNVLFNPLEMGGKTELLTTRILENQHYQEQFRSAFPNQKPGTLTPKEIAKAIASYVHSLSPMNSAFDRYIRGDATALTPEQIDGFNLFMGKAQCGTCHFIPYFNSLLPPLFEVSEVEILGTPKNEDLDHPQKDEDAGRYDLFHIRYYKGAFKTPTVRNASKTAPYMHNGAFQSLEQVIEFYNRGGGVGIGLTIPDQTLSATPLNLTTTETNHILSFIESLTDSL